MAQFPEFASVPHPRVIAKNLLNCYDRFNLLTYLRMHMDDDPEYETTLSDLNDFNGERMAPQNITIVENLEMIEVQKDSANKVYISPLVSPLWRVVTPLNKALGLEAVPTVFEGSGQISEQLAKQVGKRLLGSNRRAFLGMWFAEQTGLESISPHEAHHLLADFLPLYDVRSGMDNFVKLEMLAIPRIDKKPNRAEYHLTNSPLWELFRVLREVTPVVLEASPGWRI